MKTGTVAKGADLHPSSASGWEHFPHDADIGVRGFGATLEAAFEQAARALTAAVTDPQKVAARDVVEIVCEAPDRDFLFVEWLNALIYEMATRRMLFSRFAVHIRGSRSTLRATSRQRRSKGRPSRRSK